MTRRALLVEPREEVPDTISVRDRNAALDREISELAAAVTPAALHAFQGDGRWTLAEQLGHVGEFAAFFAQDLHEWLVRRGPVGRTHEHPARLEAVEMARGKSLDELLAGLELGFRQLSAVLGRLTDGHLTQETENRKYGAEPLLKYLDRYILHHKAKHIDQLRRSMTETIDPPSANRFG